jgi:hypothetical protein
MNYIPRSELVASKSHLLKCSKTSWYDRFPEWFASKVRGGLTKKIDGVEVPHPMLSSGRGDFKVHDSNSGFRLRPKLERIGVDPGAVNDELLSHFGSTAPELPKVDVKEWELARLSGAHEAPLWQAKAHSMYEHPIRARLGALNIFSNQSIYDSLAGHVYDMRVNAQKKIMKQLKRDDLDIKGSSPALANFLEAAARRDVLAGARGDNNGGLSAAGLIGHGIQGGGILGAGLTLPYIIDRIKKHIKLEREQREQHEPEKSNRKKASIGADIGDFFNPTCVDPDDIFNPYKRHNRISASGAATKPAFVASLALSYYLARKAMLDASNYASDKHLDHLEKEDKDLISDALMVNKKANTDDSDSNVGEHTTSGKMGNPNIGLLLALWSLLIPPFYSFGKRIGQDTSGAYRHNKFKEALRDMESRTSNAIRFNATPSGKLNTRPGAFFGETVVDLPTQQIAEKNKKEEDNDLLDESIFT